ncbi:hypothetical protein JCM3775_003739 [Rhodotorula graminis]
MTATPWDPKSTPYPHTRRADTVETFKSATRGDVAVPDPYSWLHQPDSAETTAWVQQQTEFTNQYLEQFKDAKRFKEELTKNWDYPRFSCPALKGDGNYYFTYNSGLQPQPSIYRFPKGQELTPPKAGEVGGELFFDPNLLSTDGSVSRATSAFSEDGKYFAYALSRSGSDWNTIYVRPTSAPHDPSQQIGADAGRLEPDVLRFVKFSGIGWSRDSLGFFYQRFPERAGHGKDTDDKAGTETDKDVDAAVYYHRVGTSQSDDVLVYKDDKNREWMFSADMTEDGRYIVLTQSRDTARSNLLWIADLEAPENKGRDLGNGLEWTKVVDEWGSSWSDVANDGSKFYFYTNAHDSPNYKVVTYDLAHPSQGFTDLVAHDPTSPLTSLHIGCDDQLVLLYSVDVKDELYLHELATGKRVRRLAENLLGSVDQIAGRRKDKDMWFSMTSFTSPGTVYRYDLSRKGKGAEGATEVVYREAKVEGIKPDDFVSEQVFYESKDGTRVPMFVTRPKDVERNGKAPCLAYGYGGFSASMTPFFSPALLTWIKHYKGVLAVANIRGGAEYGENWHLAGTKERKQNVFDDFQWAAKYLVSEGFAAKGKVAISGGSNGGLLVGACVNQAPELFGAAIADVGVLDMLRFDRFTIGSYWTSDYGVPSDPEAFDYLYAYSPLHNVDPRKAPYPPTMLLTADHDDRVVPLHSFKHAAELQYQLPDNPNPLLIRIDTKSGHGAGKSTEKKIEEAVAKYGFVSQAMGLEWHD